MSPFFDKYDIKATVIDDWSSNIPWSPMNNNNKILKIYERDWTLTIKEVVDWSK